MENLTRMAGLVSRVNGYGGRPGYHQVVFRETPRGEEWVSTVPPGEAFRPTLVQRAAQKLISYHVTAEQELHHRFARLFQTYDGVNDFTLSFGLFFRIQDPRKLVAAEHLDPLRKLEEAASREIGGALRRLPWPVIWSGGAEFVEEAQRILDRRTHSMTTPESLLSDRAGAWGLEVLRVDVERSLPEDAVSPEEEATLEGKRKKAREFAKIGTGRRIEEAQKDAELASRLQDQRAERILESGETPIRLVRNLQQIVDRVSAQVDSVPQLRRTVQELVQLRAEAQLILGPWEGEAPGGALDSPAAPPGLPRGKVLLLESESNPLESLFGDLLENLGPLPPSQHAAVVSPALRLLACLLANSSNDEVSREQDQLHAGLDEHLETLSDEQVSCIRRLLDVDRLSRRLQNEQAS